MVNRFGNPILGPGELYDINNKVVKGELGILPKTNQGNLIKLNVNTEPLTQNIEKENQNDINNNNISYKTPKPRLNETNKNNNNDLNDNNNKKDNLIPLNIKPLIGSDGKPIRDKNNNQILLDKNGNKIQDPNIKLLIDKSGFPVFNTLGQSILLDKERNPLNVDEDINQIPEDKNMIKNNNNKYPELKESKKKIRSGKNRKKKKIIMMK